MHIGERHVREGIVFRLAKQLGGRWVGDDRVDVISSRVCSVVGDGHVRREAPTGTPHQFHRCTHGLGVRTRHE